MRSDGLGGRSEGEGEWERVDGSGDGLFVLGRIKGWSLSAEVEKEMRRWCEKKSGSRSSSSSEGWRGGMLKGSGSGDVLNWQKMDSGQTESV